MVEFQYNEAEEFLKANLNRAEKKLSSIEKEMAFLKDQITTMEVSMYIYVLCICIDIARVYNYNVRQKQPAAK